MGWEFHTGLFIAIVLFISQVHLYNGVVHDMFHVSKFFLGINVLCHHHHHHHLTMNLRVFMCQNEMSEKFRNKCKKNVTS